MAGGGASPCVLPGSRSLHQNICLFFLNFTYSQASYPHEFKNSMNFNIVDSELNVVGSLMLEH